MQILRIMPSLALLMWIGAAAAQSPENTQKTYSLSVSRHVGVPALSKPDVEKILSDASKMLQRRSASDDDVPCNVTFELKGPIGTFASPTKPVVNESNIAAVHRVDSDIGGVDFHVKVVEEIDFCRKELTGKFQGCSFSPPDFRSIIVVHPSLHQDSRERPLASFPDHLLWAHEFGHLTGLGHRDDDSDALMTPCPLDTQFAGHSDALVRVNDKECRHLRAGPGKPPPAPFSGNGNCRR